MSGGRHVRGLYALTPNEADTAALLRAVEAALVGGTRLLQYRNKSASPELRALQARELQALCAAHRAQLIVNDFPALAAQVGAAGVHVGREDDAIPAARALLGDGIVGASCYNELQRAIDAQAAVEALGKRAGVEALAKRARGADYVAFGSFFASSTKPGAVRATLDLLRGARARLHVPIVAIGGITLDNARALIDAGADAIAVSSALFGAADIAAAARAFNHLFEVTK
jgi:thiamine-phosphate pyrophosphorylase